MTLAARALRTWGVLLTAAILVAVFGVTPVTAQQTSAPGLWRDVDEQSVAAKAVRRLTPSRYRTLELDGEGLRGLLARAPLEFTPAARAAEVLLEIPWPDGGTRRFRIEDSPMMEAGLAAQFPELKTYSGQGIDDPTASMRFDVTPAGFHAMVLSADGTVYVDPYAAGDTRHYISYYRRDYARATGNQFSCGVTDKEVTRSTDRRDRGRYLPSQATSGTQLRTYRLALAANAEYTAVFGGAAGAASAMLTTMNRVNGIYERDLSVRMTLVAGNSALIYTNPSTDPYSNTFPNDMLCQNAKNIDVVIGQANYDIGHLFSTGGFGTADQGVVCSNDVLACVTTGSAKGRGVTGRANPVGDAFDIDFVAHYIGHQFGANHTFNSVTGNCGGARDAGTAYEPGSGSTIMADPGGCGADKLQAESDDYFHAASQTELIAFTQSGIGSTCGTVTATGNTPPTVFHSGLNYTIPKSTPFTLTASGSDINGDTLTYAWEQLDLGAPAPPNSDDGTRPLFRSYSPSTSSSRTFPSLSYILNNANVPPATISCTAGTCLTGEVLASIGRVMHFTVTARDNRAGGGGTASDSMSLTVSAASGPFVVTAPNTPVSLVGNNVQTVTWNVANTTAAPVSAANVKISLSTDGGVTFPTTLVASTPNDGSHVITVPNLSTSTARIKVEAVGNIFFDISDTNFTITAAASAPVITLHPAATTTVLTGQTIFFSTSAGGSPAPTSQWQVNVGSGWVNIPGATGPNLAFAAQRLDNGKQYRNVYTNASGSAATNAAALFVRLRVRTDLDADRKSELMVWRPGDGYWYWLYSASNYLVSSAGAKQWGNAGLGDVPLSGDIDGDGRMDLVVWRGSTGTWYWLTSSSNYDYAAIGSKQWGNLSLGDVPMLGDIDGDGKSDLIIWRASNGTWYWLNSSTGYDYSLSGSKQWGNNGLADKPLLGDFDGDGLVDLTVWRASTGTWHWLTSASGYAYAPAGSKQWGNNGLGDIPITADIDGDGVGDLIIWRGSDGTFYWLTAASGYNYAVAQAKQWGSQAQGDIPMLSDLDGDTVADLVVWRATNGTWFWLTSSTGFAYGSLQSKQWGASGDIPMNK